MDLSGTEAIDRLSAGRHAYLALPIERCAIVTLATLILNLATPIYLSQIVSLAPKKQPSNAPNTRLHRCLAIAAAEIAHLALWSVSTTIRSQVSTSVAYLSFILLSAVSTLLYAEYRHPDSPCTFLSLCLAASVVFELFTSYSSSNQLGLIPIGIIHTSISVLKLTALILEVAGRPWVDWERLRNPLKNYATKGFWDSSFLIWLHATVIVGFKKDVRVEDLPYLGPEFNSEVLFEQFRPHWKHCNNGSKYALIRACIRTIPRECLATFVPRLSQSAVTFAQPFLLHRIISGAGLKQPSTFYEMAGIIGATALVQSGIALTTAHSRYVNQRVITFTRAILTVAVFDKTLRISANSLDNASVATLIKTDIASIEDICSMFQDLWASLIEICLGVWVLWSILGPAAISVLLPALIITIVTKRVTKRMQRARKSWDDKAQKRLTATSNILAQVKALKMSGLTSTASKTLRSLHDEELNASLGEKHERIILHVLALATRTLTPAVALGGYLFWTKEATPLSIAEMFSAVAIVTIICSPLCAVYVCIPIFMSRLSSFMRIQEFLRLEEVTDSRILAASDARPGNVVEICNVSTDIAQKRAALTDVSLKFPIGRVSMIIGSVGCGTSTLINVLLGELAPRQGSVKAPSRAMAYCNQTPWLPNMGIRDIIIGHSNYLTTLYKSVLFACGLEEALKSLPQGDETFAGPNGSSLNDGLKQQVALARAVYCGAFVLVLDEPLSALATPIAKTVMYRLFSSEGIVRKMDTTVILTSNMPECLPIADRFFALDGNGRVQEHESRDTITQQLNEQRATQPQSVQEPVQDRQKHDTELSVGKRLPSVEPATEDSSTEEEETASAISYYMRAAGWFWVVLWLFTIALAAISEKFPYIYMRIWMSRAPHDNSYWLGLPWCGAASVLFTIITTALYYLKVIPKTARTLHLRLLQTVMRSSLRSISSADYASILNRFGQDIAATSHVFPLSLMEASYVSLSVVIDILAVAGGAPHAILVVPLALAFFYFIQHFYLRASRRVRLLNLDNKSPIYSHFAETASGVEHIRAFQWQGECMWQAYAFLDYSQRVYYYQFCIDSWLSLALNTYVCVMAIVFVGLSVAFAPETSQPVVGLALLSLLTSSSTLSDLMLGLDDLTISGMAVNRIKNFNEQTPIEAEDDSATVPSCWPTSGEIELRSVSATVERDAKEQTVLNAVNVTIRHGQKVVIGGRTCSGKSSLILALLGFFNHRGTILIGGRDIRTIPRRLLRSRIITVSEAGVHLLGSVRMNLSTAGETAAKPSFDDKTLIAALEKVGLWSHIRSLGASLSTELERLRLSPSQKQLLCLARAILCREKQASKVVLMDEATSQLDVESDQRIQEILKQEFSDCTVIMVTHRAHAIEHFDTILQLGEGRITRALERDPDTREWMDV